MADSFKSRTLRALSWSFLESTGVQSIQVIVGIVLARLLLPEQFGLIGMLTIFMAVAQSFLDSGFGAALIQKREVTPRDTCSIFYFNVVVGAAVAALLWLVAPYIAAFYNQPVLTPLTRVLSLTIVINSFGLVQVAMLSKQINFKIISAVGLIASGLSGIIAVCLAAWGFGVWSLAVQMIANSLFRTALLWILYSWRPALLFSFHSLRQMFGFGSRVLASGLLDQIFSNLYLLVIGKLFTPADLGFFTRADGFAGIPSRLLSRVIGNVSFPVFASIQDDPVRLKKTMKRALTSLVLVNFPAMIGLILISRPLVLFLLTEKWAESIPYIRLLGFLGLLYPLHVINLHMLQALGRSKLFLRLEVIKKILIVINIAVTWRWGISAMIYGMIITSLFSYYLNSYYTGTLIGYPIREQLRDLFPYMTLAALMGSLLYGTTFLPFPNNWSVLLVQIPLGIFVYGSLCRFFRLPAFLELWQEIWSRMSPLRTG